MKRAPLILTALLILSPVPSHAFARRWVTVDHFVGSSGSESVLEGLGAFGDLVFSAGGDGRGTSERWLVRRSLDSGGTWAIAEEGLAEYSGQSGARATLVLPGAVYVAGYAVSESMSHWIVQKSANQGATWSTVDDEVDLDGVDQLAARSIGMDGDGVLYVSGVGGASSETHWFVRRSADGGNTWSTVDDFPFTAHDFPEPRATLAGKGTGVLVGGVADDGWVVRHSPDGVSWSTVDQVAGQAQLFGGAIDPGSGEVAFVGQSAGHWIVRRSNLATAGDWATWDVVPGASVGLEAAFTPDGQLFVGGLEVGVINGKSEESFVIRRAATLFRGFSDDFRSKPYPNEGYLANQPSAMTSNRRGDIFAMGLIAGEQLPVLETHVH